MNDLSLCGQFADPHAFRAALEPVLKLRARRADLRSRLLCSRGLYLRPVTPSSNLQQTVVAIPDPNFRKLALGWFANAGPFWDDTRTTNPNDYFHFDGQDVTDQGLGEAARRCLDQLPAAAFSFAVPPFVKTQLAVEHGLPEEPLGSVDLSNAWTVETLESFAPTRMTSWAELLQNVADRMPLLVLSPDIPRCLESQPFQSSIAERALVLLDVLQTLAAETQQDGSLSAAGHECHQRYFTGREPRFTDESDSNKSVFASELTFRDPANPTQRLFCPWHGKIPSNFYRIHFEWKRPAGQREIKVVYIGPKITKH